MQIIVLEGVDDSGKTEVIKSCYTCAKELGFEVTLLKDPGTTEEGLLVREILLNQSATLSQKEILDLFIRSRKALEPLFAEHKDNPNHIFIMDRYFQSTQVYQGILGGLHKEVLDHVNNDIKPFMLPTLTFFLEGIPNSLKTDDIENRYDRNKAADAYRTLWLRSTNSYYITYRPSLALKVDSVVDILRTHLVKLL